MKKIFFSLFFLSSLLLLLNSCKTDTYYNFDEDDEKWLIYSQGRVMKFQDSTGTTEIYYINDKSRGYKNDGSTFYQHADMAVLKNNDSTSISTHGRVYAIKLESGLSITITWPHHPTQLQPLTQIPTSLTVKGKTYTDVYVSEADPLFMSPDNDIIKFYYSKAFGFIRFDRFNGSSFELIN